MAAALRRAALAACAAGFGLAACAAPGLSPHKDAGAKPVPGVGSAVAASPSPTPAPAYPQRRPLDQDRPVRVRSRSLRYDHDTGETVFYGGVTATQDTTTLLSKELRSRDAGQDARATGGVLVLDRARRLRIHSGEADYAGSLGEAQLSKGVRLVSVDPYGAPLTVTGRTGYYSGLSRDAEVDGGVTVLRGPLRAKAERAFVVDGGLELKLQKDVRAAMGINRLQSDQAEFDRARRWVDLIGDVRIRMVPDQLRAAAAEPWDLGAAISPTAGSASGTTRTASARRGRRRRGRAQGGSAVSVTASAAAAAVPAPVSGAAAGSVSGSAADSVSKEAR